MSERVSQWLGEENGISSILTALSGSSFMSTPTTQPDTIAMPNVTSSV